mmetsp:Transcript_1087/g.1824  ORF Transcript_1087/g.1824 Transcript_1087/m.1824 type:complete len:318 (-) Transcript_1087:5-958(-)
MPCLDQAGEDSSDTAFDCGAGCVYLETNDCNCALGRFLESTSIIPAALHVSNSLWMELAVKPTMGMWSYCGTARTAFVVSTPSRRGICKSIKINAYAVDSPNFSSTSSPSGTMTQSATGDSIDKVTFCNTGLSSATRILRRKPPLERTWMGIDARGGSGAALCLAFFRMPMLEGAEGEIGVEAWGTSVSEGKEGVEQESELRVENTARNIRLNADLGLGRARLGTGVRGSGLRARRGGGSAQCRASEEGSELDLEADAQATVDLVLSDPDTKAVVEARDASMSWDGDGLMTTSSHGSWDAQAVLLSQLQGAQTLNQN